MRSLWNLSPHKQFFRASVVSIFADRKYTFMVLQIYICGTANVHTRPKNIETTLDRNTFPCGTRKKCQGRKSTAATEKSLTKDDKGKVAGN